MLITIFSNRCFLKSLFQYIMWQHEIIFSEVHLSLSIMQASRYCLPHVVHILGASLEVFTVQKIWTHIDVKLLLTNLLAIHQLNSFSKFEMLIFEMTIHNQLWHEEIELEQSLMSLSPINQLQTTILDNLSRVSGTMMEPMPKQR